MLVMDYMLMGLMGQKVRGQNLKGRWVVTVLLTEAGWKKVCKMQTIHCEYKDPLTFSIDLLTAFHRTTMLQQPCGLVYI